jgi:hypothetical protein
MFATSQELDDQKFHSKMRLQWREFWEASSSSRRLSIPISVCHKILKPIQYFDFINKDAFIYSTALFILNWFNFSKIDMHFMNILHKV